MSSNDKMNLIHKHFIRAQSYIKKTLHGVAYCIKYMFVLNKNGNLKEYWIRQEFQKDLWEERKQLKQFGVFKEFQIPTKLTIKCKPS